MSEAAPELSGPDLTAGIDARQVPEGGLLLGHAEGEPVLLARTGGEVFAVGAQCTHYSGPLAEGIVADGTVRCPWHHACFSLRTGEALRAPALDPIACWTVEERDGSIRLGKKLSARDVPAPAVGASDAPAMVILGAGAAGNAAAEMLRRQGFQGRVLMIGGEPDRPYDRPNLSKDYLAGTAEEAWIPLRPAEFYADRGIELLQGVRATTVDPDERVVRLEDGRSVPYDHLLLATGAEPIRLDPATHALPHVFTLRSLADCRAIIAAASAARRAVVVGSSFIGLEVAASLRKRGLAVTVVSRDSVPFERSLGREVGQFLRQVHEANGVTFHLGRTVRAISPAGVTLDEGTTVPADLVVVGIGVRPRVELAQRAGLAVNDGVEVNEYLETTRPGIFAAGDIASWPDARSGRRVRIEHWVVAERQGQTAARNMLGEKVRYTDVPFFWTWHHDVALNYVGHHERSAQISVTGSLEARDARVTYRENGRITAVATIGRDRENLQAEVTLERETG